MLGLLLADQVDVDVGVLRLKGLHDGSEGWLLLLRVRHMDREVDRCAAVLRLVGGGAAASRQQEGGRYCDGEGAV